MRILVTCDRYPSPKSEGLVLRIYHYVKRLRGKHDFDLVCLDRTPHVHDAEVESLFGQVVRVPYAGRGPVSGWARVRAAFDIADLYPQSPDATAAIAQLMASQRYDLIWDAGANMMSSLSKARRQVPLLADQVDDTLLALQRQLALAEGAYRRLWLRKQLHLQRRFARRVLAPAPAVLFVSPLDEASFKRACPGARTVTIANGVDENFFRPGLRTGPAPQRPELVFEGVMKFGPNVDAVQYFVKDILAHIRQQQPDVHFTVVGRDPVPEVQALASPHVEVTGFVDDVRPWLARAQVFVCPMRSGAGIKNKILQAWAMGLAVVSTSEGAHGLDARDGQNMLIRDTPQAFASAVLGLLADPATVQRLGVEGRRMVEQHYAWSSKAAELDALFSRVAAEAAGI